MEIKKASREPGARHRRATAREISDRKIDVGVGALVSNVVMFFIILTAALTLHKQGLTHIETSRQASEALKPLAGPLAAALYTVGIAGVGFLAIPTLAGSAAYAFAETFRWRAGLDEKFHRAAPFYIVIIALDPHRRAVLLSQHQPREGALLDRNHQRPARAVPAGGILWSPATPG